MVDSLTYIQIRFLYQYMELKYRRIEKVILMHTWNN